MSTDNQPEPFLRTLAPLLRALESKTRTWLVSPRPAPLGLVERATLEGLTDDLGRNSLALDAEKPLLVIMLMGGTGVGKSSLMNAFAGAAVASASYARPTTRDPVVYVHESVRPERLDPSLRNCRLATHNRDTLIQKVIVDTPDVDSNDLANRETLIALLPHADVVLYVGSQEKYHDKLGWELFKEQRQRRAFAFVMNKWDRASQSSETGTRPDEDWLRDLKAEGFTEPKLFRTTAQLWIDSQGQTPANLPSGEQFAELREWLELGLTRMEIEAVKARGVSQLLSQLEKALEAARPPLLHEAADAVKQSWVPLLDEEANAQADVLANTVEPFQQEIEHHFATQGQQRFRGIMAAYLRITRKLRYAGNAIRERVTIPGGSSKPNEPSADWELASVAHDCAKLAEDRSLTARQSALASKLLIEADYNGFPLNLLDGPTAEAGKSDWHDRMIRSLVDSLSKTEAELTAPVGWKRIARGTAAGLANVLPEITFVVSIAVVLWQFAVQGNVPTLMMALMPIYATLGMLIILHVIIGVLLPVRWSGIRSDFRRHLGEGLNREFQSAYASIPRNVALAVASDRQRFDELFAEVRKVENWLVEKEMKANVSKLYGS
ncbi:MAG: GTPase domain-containing protein [Gemmataceae bacterium]